MKPKIIRDSGKLNAINELLDKMAINYTGGIAEEKQKVLASKKRGKSSKSAPKKTVARCKA